jgi:hypothetical protein
MMPALVTAFLAYFVLTRRWFWVALLVLWAIGGLTGPGDR